MLLQSVIEQGCLTVVICRVYHVLHTVYTFLIYITPLQVFVHPYILVVNLNAHL